MKITSGYRCPKHPIEAKKAAPGAHSTGLACDIGVSGSEAYQVLSLAMELGFTGIGVQQKGTGRFIHVDLTVGQNRPTVWSY
jgi:zinc D-Ala-D-Ala carboxypeptidase